MTNIEVVRAMEAEMHELRLEEAQLEAKLAEVRLELEAGRRFMRRFSASAGIKAASGITALDLAGSRTIYEGLVRFAELNGGYLNVREAGMLLHEAGVMQGKRDSTQSSAHKAMDKHKQHWSKVEPGLYKYVPQGVSEETANEAKRMVTEDNGVEAGLPGL